MGTARKRPSRPGRPGSPNLRHRPGCVARPRAPSAKPGRDRGALSLMIVILFAGLVALAGIVVDGGAKLVADENAVALAQEAARAGATTVDTAFAYGQGRFVVDEQRAVLAARDYLESAGYHRYTVAAVGSDAIEVSVTITEPTRFLSLIGVRSFTCTGWATASLVTSVTGRDLGAGNPGALDRNPGAAGAGE